MQLSKNEEKMYSLLNRNNILIFRIKDLQILMNIDKFKSYNLIKSLKKKQAITKINGEYFALTGTDNMVIGQVISTPSYISFWTALNYYGYSDQNPKKIFYATTSYKKSIKNYIYVTLNKRLFYGYKSDGNITIAEKEKAIIDSLIHSKYSGGMKHVIDCLKVAKDDLDMKKLYEYAIKTKNNAVIRRLGFSLELIGCDKRLLNNIEKQIGKGYELLDPNLKIKKIYNKKWGLNINI